MTLAATAKAAPSAVPSGHAPAGQAPATTAPASQASPRWLLGGIACIAVAAGLLAATLVSVDRPRVAVVWGGLAFAVYAWGLLCCAGGWRGLVHWRLGSWSLAWCAVVFGIATLTWSRPQIGTPAKISVVYVLDALALTAVAMTCWFAGYLAGPGRPLLRVAQSGMRMLAMRRRDAIRSLATPWILYAIAVLAQAGTTATSGRFGYVGDPSSAVVAATSYDQILAIFGLYGHLAVAAASLQVFHERLKAARLTLACLFCAEVVVSAVSGSKEGFVVTVLALMIPYCTARDRLPKLAVLSAVGTFLLVVVPFNQEYRHVARGHTTLTATDAISVAPDVFASTVGDGGITAAVAASAEQMFRRIRGIDSPAIILQRTPSTVAYRGTGEIFAAPLIGLVPRALWPGKPILATGYRFGQTYFDAPATTYSSTAITPHGDLYRHGGWLVMGFGMVVFGAAVRLFDDAADVRSTPHAVFFVLIFFPAVVKYEQDFVTMLASVPSSLVVASIAVLLTFRPRARTMAGA